MTEIKMPSDEEVIAELRLNHPKLHELNDQLMDTVKEVAINSSRIGSEIGYNYGFIDGDKVRGEAEAKQFIVMTATTTFTTIFIVAMIVQFITQKEWGVVGLAVVLNTGLHYVNRKIASKLMNFVTSKKED